MGEMANADAAGSPRRILVVEDNELNMKLFRDLLEAQGYIVIATRDGMEALRLAGEQKPDLVLMDIQLPEISGFEVAKLMKNDPMMRDIPIIAVTAFAMTDDDERVKSAGCATAIAKPISIKPFLELIARMLNGTAVSA